MKKLLSIREFAKISGIPSSTLRYWDEIGLFSPSERGPDNNYRYYAPQQIIAVNFITVLSNLNVPLKTIGQTGAYRTPGSIIRLIERQEKLLDQAMRRLQECYSIIHTRREQITYGQRVLRGFRIVNGDRIDDDEPADQYTYVDVTKVVVMHRDDLGITIGPRTNFKAGEDFYDPFSEYCNQASKLRINLSLPIGGIHNNWHSFMQAPGEPHHFFSVDPSGHDHRKAGPYVVGYHRGYYGQFGDLHTRMMHFITKNNLTVTGPVYSIYLLDEVSIQNPDEYLVQVCVAVSKKPTKPQTSTNSIVTTHQSPKPASDSPPASNSPSPHLPPSSP